MVGQVKRRRNDFHLDKFLSRIPYLQELRDWNNMINLSLSETKLISFFQMNDLPRTLSSCSNHHSSAARNITVSKTPRRACFLMRLARKKVTCLRSKFLQKQRDSILHFNCGSLSEYISKMSVWMCIFQTVGSLMTKLGCRGKKMY